MTETQIKDAKEFISAERLTTTLTDLINVPSPTGEEQALAEHLFTKMSELGLRCRLDEVEPGESNVIGRLEGSGGGATLLMLGHLDTTWSGFEDGIRELGPGYKPVARRDGDWIYGMGAYNMKCGLATMVEAVNAVVDSGVELTGDIVLAGVVGESPKAQVRRYQGAQYRGAGKGARHLVSNGVVADFCVVPEPTNGHISIASGGYVFLEIETGAHPGATYLRRGSVMDKPEPDAIERMNGVLSHLSRWGTAYSERSDAVDGVPTHFRVVAIEGGLAYRPSKQPPFCRAMVEVGARPGQSLVEIVEQVKAVVRESEYANARVELVQAVPGASVNPDELLVGALREAHEREFDEPATLTSDGWLADTTHLTRYGIPAVCYSTAGRVRTGGSGFYAHDGEQSYVPDLVRGARVFADLMVDLGRRSRAELTADLPNERGTVVL